MKELFNTKVTVRLRKVKTVRNGMFISKAIPYLFPVRKSHNAYANT